MQENLQNDQVCIDILKKENTELQRFLSVTRDLFCVFAYSGQIVAVNASWKESLGYSDSRLVGRNIFEIIAKEDLYATKFAISESAVLGKQSELSKKEVELIRRHPETGYQILRSVDAYAPVAMIVLSHHEWVNGKGYPEQLKKEEIPLPSRIIAVADAYDAMTSGRPNNIRRNKEEAIEELQKYSGTQFDPDVVAAFKRVMVMESCDDPTTENEQS